MAGLGSKLPVSRIPDPGVAPPIRWGIIGPGGIAARFTDTVHRNTRSRVAAVGSRSAERARAFADRFGIDAAHDSYERLVADPGVDAVYVATPHSEHHAHAMMALDAGKPVLVEKAFTQNSAEAGDVVAAARASGTLVMEAMWTRFLPGIDVVRRLLDDGTLGDIQTVIADHGQYFDVGAGHRLLNSDLAGGALLDLGVYPVSFASFVLGPPDTVVAGGDLTETGVDAQVSILIRAGRAHGLISTTQTAKTPTTASISGSQARVEIPGDFYQPNRVLVTGRDGTVLTAPPGPLHSHEGLAYEAAHFATLLGEGQTESPLLGLDETLSIMATLDEIRAQIGLSYPGETPRLP